jgi:hypothetical protein
MYGAFKTAWDANTPAVTPDSTVPQVYYEGVGTAGPGPQDAPWARASIRHTLGGQSTLSNENGARRFEKSGIITIGIFTPFETGGGLVLSENLAVIAKAAFEGKSTASNVWFRDVRINEVGADGPWFHVNVVAEFIYDEIVT